MYEYYSGFVFNIIKNIVYKDIPKNLQIVY